MVSDEQVDRAFAAYAFVAGNQLTSRLGIKAVLEDFEAASPGPDRTCVDRDAYEKAVSALATANWFGNDSHAVAARDRLDALIEPFLAPSTPEETTDE